MIRYKGKLKKKRFLQILIGAVFFMVVMIAMPQIQAQAAGKNGVAKAANGNWYYYVENKVQASYNGLAKYNNAWWYFKNGKLNFSYTGLCKYKDNWWYVENGKVNFNKKTLCKYNNAWWYVTGGKVNFNAKGLCKYNNAWWYISGGKVNFNVTGLCKYNGNWWYVEDGKVNFDKTTLCKYNGSWWYVTGGKVDFNYTGYMAYNGANWNIKNGKMIHQGGNKIIYLTFDDGPGPYTEQLLDVLDKYGVKATFFVTNQKPKYQNMIGEAYRRGHTIALHTYSHSYSIYKSETAYYKDLKLIEDLCVAQTGEKPTIVRFPGGTSNTISRRYCKGIMSSLANSLDDHGYVYCDWNVTSGDAGGTTTESGVFNNVIKGVKGKSVSVVLQHDIKKFSVAAVDDIIEWGLANGYTFLPLTEDSPMVHHSAMN